MGAGTNVATVTVPSGHVIVSCRTEEGNLRLISFAVEQNGNTVVRRGDSGSAAGAIGHNALVARPYGAVSAVSTSDGDLKLIKWEVDGAGAVTRAGDSADQAGRARLVSVAFIPAVSVAPSPG